MDALARRTELSKSFYVREAIRAHLKGGRRTLLRVAEPCRRLASGDRAGTRVETGTRG
ncbi:MAG: hypothetical protein F2702_03990 [Actinobacteria bacterium]|nr:hypothetical protein [Actinomycetota bacterium]